MLFSSDKQNTNLFSILIWNRLLDFFHLSGMNWYLQCAVFKVQSDWTFISHSITESYFFSHNLSSFFCYRITGKTSLSTALPCRFWVSHRFLWPVLSQTASCSFSFTPVFCSDIRNIPLIFFVLLWQPPTLPYRLQYSTLGRSSLNRRVRNGYGCVPWTHRHQKSLVFFFLTSKSEHS